MTREDFESSGEQIESVPVIHNFVPEERLILSWKLTPEEFVFVSNSASKNNFKWSKFHFSKQTFGFSGADSVFQWNLITSDVQ
jgi:hypothetical protein